MNSEWQIHVLKTLWNIRNINTLGGDDTTGLGALLGRSAKVAANWLERAGLVERIERGVFVEPAYRLTPAGKDAARELFEPAQAGGDLVHRIEPSAVATLCGAEGKWRAVNTAMGVTCPRCMELLHTTAPAQEAP